MTRNENISDMQIHTTMQCCNPAMQKEILLSLIASGKMRMQIFHAEIPLRFGVDLFIRKTKIKKSK